MTDIAERLRTTASKGVSVWGELQMEAADEIQILRAERDNLTASFERASLDAARYRWLRDVSNVQIEVIPDAAATERWPAEELDATIDAAMKG